MKILICGINCAPELIGIGKYTGEMAEWLTSRGAGYPFASPFEAGCAWLRTQALQGREIFLHLSVCGHLRAWCKILRIYTIPPVTQYTAINGVPLITSSRV